MHEDSIVSEPTPPVLLATVSCLSEREVEGAGPTTLTIETWSDGNSRFQWLVNGNLIGQIVLCINAFFNVLQTLPQWFATIGSPAVYDSCGGSDDDPPVKLICLHLEDYPEIGLGMIGLDVTQPNAMVMLARGTVISLLDTIGHRLATLDGVYGCAGPDAEADAADSDDAEADDPFAGLDVSVRH